MNTTLTDIVKASTRGSLWRKVRNDHLDREKWCQICGRHKELEVHHKIPWKDSKHLRHDPNNLVTLCRPCHFRFGHLSNWKDSNRNIDYYCGRNSIAMLVRKVRGWDVATSKK